MATSFSMQNDTSGNNSFAPMFSDKQFQVLLSANVESTLTIPETGNATLQNWIAVFSCDPGDSIWVSRNGTATVPSSGTFAACECELNPATRYVLPGDVLSFISSDTTDQVGVSLYAVA